LITDQNATFTENYAQLCGALCALRNLSSLNEFLINHVRRAQTGTMYRRFDMDKAVKGFTLIELVVVITILGILAAFAFPRFAALETEARAATVNGLAGSLRAANALAHSLSLVQGGPTEVTMEGNTIDMTFGYPDNDEIHLTLTEYTGFTRAAGPPVSFTPSGVAVAANCQVTYAEAAAAGSTPTITAVTTDCS
jgi:MSHA pilin protein MshA